MATLQSKLTQQEINELISLIEGNNNDDNLIMKYWNIELEFLYDTEEDSIWKGWDSTNSYGVSVTNASPVQYSKIRHWFKNFVSKHSRMIEYTEYYDDIENINLEEIIVGFRLSADRDSFNEFLRKIS